MSGSIISITWQGELLISWSTLHPNSKCHNLLHLTSVDGNPILPPPQIKILEIILYSSFALKSCTLFLSNPPDSLPLRCIQIPLLISIATTLNKVNTISHLDYCLWPPSVYSQPKSQSMESMSNQVTQLFRTEQ